MESTPVLENPPVPHSDPVAVNVSVDTLLEKFEGDRLVERIRLDDAGTVIEHWSEHGSD